IEERCHYTFRWWYEYSGGQLTDWGAHHVDIAQWGIGSLPVEVSGVGKLPEVRDGYNVPLDFSVRCKYANGVELTISDTGRNGVLFTGSEGRILANRGTVAGKPVDDLKARPLARDQFKLYTHDNLSRPERVGKLDAIINHMGNFFDCIQSREQPISDVAGQHRGISTCHLANISLRLGRPLKWNPQAQQIIDDSEANGWLRREQRRGYEVV
ncbi:MAG TPA: gfo/Idh/MocA family oxidoreductase, partial [Pirellulales bacterium]|nr:gfo/Idh/MocA family oxidoreductase [Pirellulales bacterium]